MDHLAEGFGGGALAPAAMPWRCAASRSLLEEELGANFADAGRQHRGVLAEDFERTRVILRGDDEGLLAHVGPDPQCGFNRFRKRARCDRFSGARETARHNMSDAKLRSYATRSAATPRSPISISATPVSPILWRLAPELKFLMRPQLHWAL